MTYRRLLLLGFLSLTVQTCFASGVLPDNENAAANRNARQTWKNKALAVCVSIVQSIGLRQTSALDQQLETLAEVYHELPVQERAERMRKILHGAFTQVKLLVIRRSTAVAEIQFFTPERIKLILGRENFDLRPFDHRIHINDIHPPQIPNELKRQLEQSARISLLEYRVSGWEEILAEPLTRPFCTDAEVQLMAFQAFEQVILDEDFLTLKQLVSTNGSDSDKETWSIFIDEMINILRKEVYQNLILNPDYLRSIGYAEEIEPRITIRKIMEP